MTETTILYCDLDGVLHALGTPAMDEFGTAHPESPRVFCWLPLLEHALRPYPDMQIVGIEQLAILPQRRRTMLVSRATG